MESAVLLGALPIEIVAMINDELCRLYRIENCRLVQKMIVENLRIWETMLLVNDRIWIKNTDFCKECGSKKNSLYSCVERKFYPGTLARSMLCKC
nr:hypothetical protein K-LCC10_0218 [Kaumoebavirus]